MNGKNHGFLKCFEIKYKYKYNKVNTPPRGMIFLIKRKINMLRRRPTRTLRNPRRLHEGWGNVSYNNIKMKQVKHLKVAVVENTDWDYNPI